MKAILTYREPVRSRGTLNGAWLGNSDRARDIRQRGIELIKKLEDLEKKGQLEGFEMGFWTAIIGAAASLVAGQVSGGGGGGANVPCEGGRHSRRAAEIRAGVMPPDVGAAQGYTGTPESFYNIMKKISNPPTCVEMVAAGEYVKKVDAERLAAAAGKIPDQSLSDEVTKFAADAKNQAVTDYNFTALNTLTNTIKELEKKIAAGAAASGAGSAAGAAATNQSTDVVARIKAELDKLFGTAIDSKTLTGGGISGKIDSLGVATGDLEDILAALKSSDPAVVALAQQQLKELLRKTEGGIPEYAIWIGGGVLALGVVGTVIWAVSRPRRSELARN